MTDQVPAVPVTLRGVQSCLLVGLLPPHDAPKPSRLAPAAIKPGNHLLPLVATAGVVARTVQQGHPAVMKLQGERVLEIGLCRPDPLGVPRPLLGGKARGASPFQVAAGWLSMHLFLLEGRWREARALAAKREVLAQDGWAEARILWARLPAIRSSWTRRGSPTPPGSSRSASSTTRRWIPRSDPPWAYHLGLGSTSSRRTGSDAGGPTSTIPTVRPTRSSATIWSRPTRPRWSGEPTGT